VGAWTRSHDRTIIILRGGSAVVLQRGDGILMNVRRSLTLRIRKYDIRATDGYSKAPRVL